MQMACADDAQLRLQGHLMLLRVACAGLAVACSAWRILRTDDAEAVENREGSRGCEEGDKEWVKNESDMERANSDSCVKAGHEHAQKVCSLGTTRSLTFLACFTVIGVRYRRCVPRQHNTLGT